jgi:3'(2'), 5'-bisphosphate nucleotidase
LNMDYAALIAALTPAIDAAGAVILDIKDKGASASLKADGSPLTLADKAAEDILLAALRDTIPEIPVVSEENADSHQMATADRFFLVDPLDGTKEFLKPDHGGGFTVNIGLVEAGMPTMGMVFAPAHGDFYWGYQGGGAFLRQANRITPLHVRDLPKTGAVAVASLSHLDSDTTAWLETHAITKTISVGSSLKFALIAAGLADVYPRFGPTMEWDTAAGDAILRAAGGMVRHPDGNIYSYGKAAYRNTPFIAYGRFGSV